MKTTPSLAALLALAVLSALSASAATFSDSTGENFTTAGGGILDISSVEVNATATDLIFKLNLTGNPTTTDWGKYMIGLTTTTGGDPSGNGWVRPIGMSSGMNYWVGSWVDSGNGGELWKYTGAWAKQSTIGGVNPDNLSISKDTSSVTLSFNYAGLGLIPGSSFNFDVYTSGGGSGDGAVDALANPNQTISDWGVAYNSGANVDAFTIPVPEPAAWTLLGLGSLVLFRRLFRRA
jgi:hypothetical protein